MDVVVVVVEVVVVGCNGLITPKELVEFIVIEARKLPPPLIDVSSFGSVVTIKAVVVDGFHLFLGFSLLAFVDTSIGRYSLWLIF